MTSLSSFLLRAGLATAIGLGVAAASSAQPAPRLDARLDRIAAEVELSAAQTAGLEAISTRYADADRAALWAAAADLADVLTAEQVDALRTAAQAERERRTHRPVARAERERGARGGRGRGGRAGRGERGGRADRAEWTDAQREALREVRAETRAETEALVDALRAGDLREADFADHVRAVREAGKARAAVVLPAEAAARMAERDAAREAETAARANALGLTVDQKAALEARRVQRVREAPERPDLRPYLDAEGRLDREAFREAQRARRDAARDARAESREEAAQILTDAQQDIVFLHRALSAGARGRMAGARGGRGRR